MVDITKGQVTIDDLDYRYLACGLDATGPLALCLHGFPDCAWAWKHLLPALADAGFRVVAPFMRGYAPTAVPASGLSPIGAWVTDVVALHEKLGGDADAVLVGHDWGALTTYGAAGFAPERWRRIVAASVPPTAVMAMHMGDYDQLKAFWYQYLFLTPNAEALVSGNDLEFIDRLWDDWSPGYDASADLPAIKEALRAPANLTAALSTYRSMHDMSLIPPEFFAATAAALAPITHPTLYLHGATDGCIDAGLAEEAAGVLPEGSRVEIIEGAGHFVQYEQPDLVNRLIVDFLTG